MNQIQTFLSAFNAALTRKPAPGAETRKRGPLTPLDRERIRKAIEKRTRKETRKP